MAHPYFEQLQHLLQDVDLTSPGIDCKHFFSGAAAYTHGQIFVSLTPICNCENSTKYGSVCR